MAEKTTLIQFKPKYYSDSNMSGCLNGGSDYRTLSSGQTLSFWLVGNSEIYETSSQACTVTSIAMSCQYRVTDEKNKGDVFLPRKGTFTYNLVNINSPSYSGSQLSMNGDTPVNGSLLSENDATIASKSNANEDYSSYNTNFSAKITGSSALIGVPFFTGAKFTFISNNSSVDCRMWLNNITFQIERTNACYITFKPNDGTSETTNYYPAGELPFPPNVYDSNSERFIGWKRQSNDKDPNNNKIYSAEDLLPEAEYYDVTYEGLWEKIEYTVTAFSQSEEGGTVNGGGQYYYGDSISLVAIPRDGYQFIRWTDGNRNINRPETVRGNTTYSAIFGVISDIYKTTDKQRIYMGHDGPGKLTIYRGNTKIFG